MTNETRERIKYYKEQLPHMKEKLAAAILMLVVAASVTVTATYAWVTLSAAPEVTNIDTTVAANGSLEIALANGTTNAPGMSVVGDSSAANNALTRANVTWGNLINLSDSSYGLSELTLRPAALSGATGLLRRPLSAVEYGQDGRVKGTIANSQFGYTYYDPQAISNADGTKSGTFVADQTGSHLGVRAISSVTYKNLGGASKILELDSAASGRHAAAGSSYLNMVNESREPGKSYINAIEGLIQTYAQNVLDNKPESTLEVTKDIPMLYDMAEYFMDEVMYPAAESYVYLVDILDLLDKDGSKKGESGYTVETLMAEAAKEDFPNANTPSYITNNMSNLTGLKQIAEDYQILAAMVRESETGDFSDFASDAERKKSLAYWNYVCSREEGDNHVYWSDIVNIIDDLCYIDGAELDDIPMTDLMSKDGITKIAGNLFGSHKACLTDGLICRMEQRLGSCMTDVTPSGPKISISLKTEEFKKNYADSLGGLVNLIPNPMKFNNVTLYTSAKSPYEMQQAYENVLALDTYQGNYAGTDMVADQTYALALDLWVRTNVGGASEKDGSTKELEDGFTEQTSTVEKTYLTLEGAIKTAERDVQKKIKDSNDEEQLSWIVTYTVSSGETGSRDEVFKKYDTSYYVDENGVEVDYQAEIKKMYSGKTVTFEYEEDMTKQQTIIGYEGVNRIWTDEQLADYTPIVKDEEGNDVPIGTSTTQGGGSCYVFYADSPQDQSRFLELLKSMKVVFIDNAGTKLCTAMLDTKNAFRETGKVTVPLALDSSEATEVGKDSNGNPIYGILPLTKNVATRITALIYLDGNILKNDMVLADEAISGMMNIQFGSSAVIEKTTITTDREGNVTDTTVEYEDSQNSEATKNEDLMNQRVTATASISQSKFSYEEGKKAEPELSVQISGVKPSKVEAQFMRAISTTQGVLLDPRLELTAASEEGKWTATCSFDKPGKYVLRTVWIDGVEYKLESSVTVEVTGNTVSSVAFQKIALTDNYAIVMTADSSFSDVMTLKFLSNENKPSEVMGVFMNEKNQPVNVDFALDGTTWTGTVRFSNSGKYTLNFVEIDGTTYEINEDIRPTVEVLLGLKAQIEIDVDQKTLEELREDYPNATATDFILKSAKPGEGVTLQVAAKVFDNNGNEITGLSDVGLTYMQKGSGIIGTSTKLKWNSATGKYEDNLYIGTFGTFNFSTLDIKIGIQTSSITKCTYAPSIIARPPGDIEYKTHYTGDDVQYAPANPKIAIGVDNSAAAGKAVALLQKVGTNLQIESVGYANNSVIETGELNDGSTTAWVFPIQLGNWQAGDMAGEWQLLELRMSGVYYNNKTYYPYTDDENCEYAVMDLRNHEIKVKVIEELQVTLNVGETRVANPNVEFMKTQTMGGATLTFTDDQGNNINELINSGEIEISGVNVAYELNKDIIKTADNGYHYSGDLSGINITPVTGSGTLQGKVGELPTGVDATTTFTISDFNFKYAGPYDKCTVSYVVKMNGVEIENKNLNSKDEAEKESSVLHYTQTVAGDDGVVRTTEMDETPVYQVYWTQLPTITITQTVPEGVTGTEQDKGVLITINTASESQYEPAKVKNYYEDDYAKVYFSAKRGNLTTTYDIPKIKVKITNEGKVLNDTNVATFSIPYNNSESTSVVMTKAETSFECAVGETSNAGFTRHHVGNRMVDHVVIKYTGVDLKVDLSKPVQIVQDNNMVDSITYVIEDDELASYYSDIDLGTHYLYDGRGSITALKMPTVKNVEYLPENMTVIEKESGKSTATQKAGSETKYVYSLGEAYNLGTKKDYTIYKKTEVTWEDTGKASLYPRTLTFNGWLINGTTYQSDAEIPINGDITAYAQIQKTDETENSTNTKDVKCTVYATKYEYLTSGSISWKLFGGWGTVPAYNGNVTEEDASAPSITSGSTIIGENPNPWYTVK